MARTSWIALLGYLAFVGVTLLAVEDADFFVPSRQTQLPLVNVAIPTASFFVFAPILAAALYVYLHIILLKLWDAIADRHRADRSTASPLGDHLVPWLVNDWALTLRGRPFSPPARSAPSATSRASSSSGPPPPLALFGFWWRSMPAHNAWLTLLLAACFLIALHAGLTSWQTARAWLSAQPPRREPRLTGPLAPPGDRPGHARRYSSLADLALDPARHSSSSAPPGPARPPSRRWPRPTSPTSRWSTSPTAGATGRPPAAFRETWCRREGLEMAVCGHPPDPEPRPPHADRADRASGAAHAIVPTTRPATPLPTSTRAFEADWRRSAASAIADLPRLDLAGRDLRAHRGRASRSSGRTSAGRGWRGRTSAARGWRGRTSAARGWRGRTSAGRGWRGRTSRRAAGGGGPRRGAAGGGGPRRRAAGGGGPRRGAAGGGGPPLRRGWRGRPRGRGWRGRTSAGRGWRGRTSAGAAGGADLRYADSESIWAGASNRASPAQFADFRGAQDLTQAQLEDLIGNEHAPPRRPVRHRRSPGTSGPAGRRRRPISTNRRHRRRPRTPTTPTSTCAPSSSAAPTTPAQDRHPARRRRALSRRPPPGRSLASGKRGAT